MKKLTSLLSLILALLMCFGILAACGKSEGGEAGSDDKPLAGTYKIKVWVADAAVELTKQQIAAYNESNTDGIVIEATVEPVGEGEAATSMTTDVEAGADIFCFAQDQTARLIQAGALSKLGQEAGKTVAADNAAGVVSAAKYGDDLYAYPLTADNGYFMYYDKSVIDEAHIDSLEDILADCEKAGKYFSFGVEDSAWYGASFFFATDSKGEALCVSEWLTDESGFTGVSDTFSSANGLIAAKGMKKLLSSKAYHNSSSGADFAAAIPSAVVVSGTWDYETVSEILGDNLGTADLPSFTVDGQSYHLGSFSGCKLLGVKPQVDAKRSAAIHKLAQYLTGEDAQRERFNALSWGPANLKVQKDDAVIENPGLSAFLDQSKYAVPQGQISGAWWDIGKALAANIKDASDDAGLQSALDAYKQAIDGIFNMSTDEKDAFTVIGKFDGHEWNFDAEMVQKPEGTWYSKEAIKFEANDEFQVRQGKAWDVQFGAVGDDGLSTKSNFVVTEAGYYYVKLVFDKAAGTGVVSLVKNSPATGYTVIGSINGDSWSKDLEMEILADGTYKTVEAYAMTAGVEFKVRQGQAWDVAFPAQNFVVDADGTYYVTFDPATGAVTLAN